MEQVPPYRRLAYEGQHRPEYDAYERELSLTEQHADNPEFWDALANAGKRDWLLKVAKKMGLGEQAKKLPAKKIVMLLRSQGTKEAEVATQQVAPEKLTEQPAPVEAHNPETKPADDAATESR